MITYQARTANVEVNGETVLSIVDGMGAFKSSAIKILAENGISEPTPGKWYSQQSWLNAFKEIGSKVGDKTLFSIGKAIPENAQFPPQIDSVHKALGAIDVAFHMNHRNGEIGNYKYEFLSEKSAKITCDNAYPCDFDIGIITAMVKKFNTDKFANITVEHSDSGACRKKGAEVCEYIVKW